MFGKVLSSGGYFPNHFFIVNGYPIKDWLKGESDNGWPVLPLFKDSFCTFKEKRAMRHLERCIVDVPNLLKISDVLWMGSIFSADSSDTFRKSNDIKR